MAIISTRPQESDPQFETNQRIKEILELYSGGMIGSNPKSRIKIGENTEELLSQLDQMLEAMAAVQQAMYNDLHVITVQNVALSIKVEEMMEILDEMIMVPFDDALDHAAADLIDAFAGTGGADMNHHGELTFDSRVSFSKADVKPILREAIDRWVQLKLS